ncbi:MAG: DUF1572 family protein [Vicinamibacterales bacterium]
MTIDSLLAEARRYKALAEATLGQLTDAELVMSHGASSNSIAAIVCHLAGNLSSRFTDFLTADGEKPWRDREAEFFTPATTREELTACWEDGWRAFCGATETLTDADFTRTITIRGQAMDVHDALHRSLAHTAYHVGQIVFLGKLIRGGEWRYLSIAPGQSQAYNQQPTRERPADAERHLRKLS